MGIKVQKPFIVATLFTNKLTYFTIKKTKYRKQG
jgi:hypothetical protein